MQYVTDQRLWLKAPPCASLPHQYSLLFDYGSGLQSCEWICWSMRFLVKPGGKKLCISHRLTTGENFQQRWMLHGLPPRYRSNRGKALQERVTSPLVLLLSTWMITVFLDHPQITSLCLPSLLIQRSRPRWTNWRGLS